MRPNFYPEGANALGLGQSKLSAKGEPKPVRQLWHLNGRCPDGTVPIRRTKKEDILRASSIEKFGKKKTNKIPRPKSAQPAAPLVSQTGHQVLPTLISLSLSFFFLGAVLLICKYIVFPSLECQHGIVYVEGDKYYGAKATINVWEPKIQQPNEFSLSQIWILGGTFGQDLNSIEAGWQVSNIFTADVSFFKFPALQ